MKFVLLFILILTTIYSANPLISYSQTLSDKQKEILTLQDKRTLGQNEELLKYLNSSENNDIRFMTLYALANISDTGSVSRTLPFVAELIDGDPDYDLLNEYAFYLSQTACAESNEYLNGMIDSPEIYLIPSYPDIIKSAGRTGDETNLNNLIKKFFSGDFTDSSAVNNALAMSIAGFALRKIKNENSVDALKKLAYTEDTITQRNVAFALWRTGDRDLLEQAKQEIYNLAESNDTQTRMWAFNAMGKLQDKQLLMYTLESYGSEQDWRVKVNMLNFILNYDKDSIGDMVNQVYTVIVDGLGDENELISLTGLNVLGNFFRDINKSGNEKLRSLSKRMSEEFIYSFDSLRPKDLLSWRRKEALANSMSLIFRDESKDVLFRAYENTDDYKFKAGIVRAFGNFENGEIYKEVRELISNDVQNYNKKNPNIEGMMIGSEELAELYRGFVEMLLNLDEKVGADDQNTIRLIFTEFAGSKDPVITDVCLNGLRDSLYMKYRDETISVLIFDYNELESPRDDLIKQMYLDAMSELHNAETDKILKEILKSDNYELVKASADALEKSTGTKYMFEAEPRYDFDWEYLEGLKNKTSVTIITNKGNIKIELLPDVAPFTVMNFLKLSEKNYYDGTIFHRVVPNFVIQGGDPTGTGYGGPGYSIRGEYSPLTYEEGMVGMASSGKDTEGSQFFITHSATPRLDGRYTIFGKVTEGMDVVDKILVGDNIEDVVIN
ncbi:MAG TPA: peptidylprolyl isomerase [Ignavibacteria bacterium]|nr:peptidylprolyl isomerase [Ignavibacteria bacterium]